MIPLVPAWLISLVAMSACIGILLVDILPMVVRLLLFFPVFILGIIYGFFQQADLDIVLRMSLARWGILFLFFSLALVSVWYHSEKRKILFTFERLRILEKEKESWQHQIDELEERNLGLSKRLGEALNHVDTLKKTQKGVQ